MRSVSILSAAALMALLSACAVPGATGSSSGSNLLDPTAIINANQQAVQVTGAVISSAGADACLVQSLANLGEKLSGGGQANVFSAASTAAGQACVYTNPVTPAAQ